MEKITQLKTLAADISILYVEDELELRENFMRYLRKFFTTIYVAVDGEDGFEKYVSHSPDLVITDIAMPKLNGLKMLEKIKQINPSQTTIIVSAYDQSNFFIDSIKLGVNAYIIKPIVHDQMLETLLTTVTTLVHAKEINAYHNSLEALVEMKAKQYTLLEEEKAQNYEKVLLALVKIIEERDSYTAGHSQRVSEYSGLLAQAMGCSVQECELLYQAGILHDIGKIATPDAILLKPEKLDKTEYKLIQEHVNVGVKILEEVPMFQPLVEIIQNHHERYDGKGYPQGLKGDDIPKLARIMIVADAFDAMTTSRIYRRYKTKEDALKELIACSGKQFHPEVVECALNVFSKLSIKSLSSQVATSPLEEERFVYFYRDAISHFYNQKYLSVVLFKNSYTHDYTHITVISLHQFSTYNKTNGWDEGNALLLAFADTLKEVFSSTLAFRIHANDFILLSNIALHLSTEAQEKIKAILQNEVTFSVRNFNIKTQKIDSSAILEDLLRLP